jgi:hypothetical protein
MLVASVQPHWLEETLIALLQANVALAIPIVLLILKLVVLRVAGDADELFRSLIALPLEVVFIAIGLVIAGLGRTIPFAAHYRSGTDADLAGTIIIIALAAILAVLNRINRYLHVLLQKFFTAMDSIKLHVEQPGFDFKPESPVTWRASVGVGLFFIRGANMADRNLYSNCSTMAGFPEN